MAIDFQPTDEELAVRDTVRAFVENELFPFESMVIQRGIAGGDDHLTLEEQETLRKKAKRSGLWGIDTPEEYGGVNLSWVAQALIQIELGKTFLNFQFGGTATDLLYLLNDDQKERYLVPTIEGQKRSCFMLSEPGVGSDAHNVRTTAVRKGDEWVINGEKTWVTSGNEADFGLVFCRTPEVGDGHGITTFIVDRDMGWTSSPIRMMGAYDPASVSFQDVRVPDANRFGDVGKGFQFAMKFIHRNRAVYLPAGMIGGCERLIQMGMEYAENRVTFGEPLSARENIRFMLAESEVELRTLKLLTLHAAWTGDTGRRPGHSACFTKFYGAQVANRIADRVLQIHGGIGYSKELPVERWYRDFRVARIYDGSDEMNLLTISRNLQRGYNKVGEIW